MNAIAITPPRADEPELLEAGSALLTRGEIADPMAFLATERGREWLKPTLSGAYYTRNYDHNRGPHPLEFCNKISNEVLERGEACVEKILDGHFEGGEGAEDVYDSEHRADVEGRIDDIADALEEMEDDTLPEIDREEWQEAVTDLVVEHMHEEDDSSVTDMFGSYDRAEVVIHLNKDSDCIYSETNCPDFNQLRVDDALASTLAALGYTVGEYRVMSGNRTKGWTTKRYRKRSAPIVTPAELREIVTEASSSHFEIVLYAVVPLPDLFDLDPKAALVLSNYSVASYDSMNGCFYSVEHAEALILEGGSYRISGPSGYSPADICGLYLPDFHATARNPAEPATPDRLAA